MDEATVERDPTLSEILRRLVGAYEPERVVGVTTRMARG